MRIHSSSCRVSYTASHERMPEVNDFEIIKGNNDVRFSMQCFSLSLQALCCNLRQTIGKAVLQNMALEVSVDLRRAFSKFAWQTCDIVDVECRRLCQMNGGLCDWYAMAFWTFI